MTATPDELKDRTVAQIKDLAREAVKEKLQELTEQVERAWSQGGARLEGLDEDIRTLKARYADVCDTGYDPVRMRPFFTEDAVWDGGPRFGRYEGVEAVCEFFAGISSEITWALLRGSIYSAVFLVTMLFFGDLRSWWAVLALPGAVLIGYGFAGVGLAATTFMRSFVDFDYVNMAMIPLFLFSATFFPLARYPSGLQAVIRQVATQRHLFIELQVHL